MANLNQIQLPEKNSNGKMTWEDNEMVSIKNYFESVLKLSQSGEEFPVDLDDVWPLVYARYDNAVRSLTSDSQFIEGIDYQPLRMNEERSGKGGQNKVSYKLSIPCLEFFIARKVRAVFNVYRQVFHKTINSVVNNGNLEHEARIKEADARLLEAKARVSELLLSISKNALTETYAQVAEAYAINTLVGKDVVALPETTEIHMKAEEIGNMFGVSKAVIGRIANKYGLKTEEYGKLFHDKSPYSHKEVESFRYNKHSIDKFRELLIKECKIKE